MYKSTANTKASILKDQTNMYFSRVGLSVRYRFIQKLAASACEWNFPNPSTFCLFKPSFCLVKISSKRDLSSGSTQISAEVQPISGWNCQLMITKSLKSRRKQWALRICSLAASYHRWSRSPCICGFLLAHDNTLSHPVTLFPNPKKNTIPRSPQSLPSGKRVWVAEHSWFSEKLQVSTTACSGAWEVDLLNLDGKTGPVVQGYIEHSITSRLTTGGNFLWSSWQFHQQLEITTRSRWLDN